MVHLMKPESANDSEPESKTINRLCPVCDSGAASTIRNVDMIVPENFELQYQYQINQCNQCGFIFHNVDPQQDRANYYGAYTGEGTVEYEVSNEQTYLNELTVSFLEKHCLNSKEQSIADIGCSFGLTLMALKDKGFNNLFAIDPDIAAISYLKERGVPGVVGGGETARKELEGQFDIIILRHVLEHLYEPRATIENVKQWLKPNGMIYVELPDLSLYPETSCFPGYFFEYEHINHFTLNALKNLMTGFSLIDSDSTTEIYPCLRALFLQDETTNAITFSSDSDFVESSFLEPNNNAKRLLKKIDNLNDGREIALWGVSIFVYRLLTHTALKNLNISYLVDGNESIQGSKVLGKNIVSPTSLQSFSGDIVICGENSENSIKNAINAMKLSNKVICLMSDE